MWGTRGLVDLAVDDSVEKVRKRRYGLDGAPANPSAKPSYKDASASTRIGVQIIGGLSVADLLAGTDTQLRLSVADSAPQISKSGKPLPQRQAGSRRSGVQRAVVWMRVDSNGRDPVWTKIPISFHRPLPENGTVQRAWLLTRRVGLRTERFVQFTVETPDAVTIAPANPSTVAVNLGWRCKQDGTIRVGYAVGSDGMEMEILAPLDVFARVEHADSIRSIRDRAFDAMVAKVRAFAESPAAPEGYRRAVAQASSWQSCDRLTALLSRWGEAILRTTLPEWWDWTAWLGWTVEPLTEAALVAALRVWAKQDQHLHFWEADERARALRNRRDNPERGYRHIAAQLAKKYDRCVVTEMDITKMAREPDAEDGARSEGSDQRRRRSVAAPSELRAALKLTFRAKQYTEAEAFYLTRTCPTCGVVADAADPQFAFAERVTCLACSTPRDQDTTHCQLLLTRVASGKVVFVQGESLAPTENEGESIPKKTPRGRFQRRRSQREEKRKAAQ